MEELFALAINAVAHHDTKVRHKWEAFALAQRLTSLLSNLVVRNVKENQVSYLANCKHLSAFVAKVVVRDVQVCQLLKGFRSRKTEHGFFVYHGVVQVELFQVLKSFGLAQGLDSLLAELVVLYGKDFEEANGLALGYGDARLLR